MILRKSIPTTVQTVKPKKTKILYNSIIWSIIKDKSISKGSQETKEYILSTLGDDGCSIVKEGDTSAKLSSFVSLKLLDEWFPLNKCINLQAPCACGKSYFAALSVLLNEDKATNLVIFRTEMYGFIKSMYEMAGISTHAILSEERLREEDIVKLNKISTIASYQNVYLKAMLNHVTEVDLEGLTLDQLKDIMITSIRDKVVFIDEADFIITQIVAESKPVYDILNREVIESFEESFNKKITALIALYSLIAQHSRKLIFMSATYNSKFNEIMGYISAQTITAEFLEQKYYERNNIVLRLNSYNLQSITEIPYIQKRLDSSLMLSDKIMCSYIMRYPERKTLIYAVRVSIINCAAVISTGMELGKRTKIIVDENRLNQGWTLENGLKIGNQESRNENFKNNVIKHIEKRLARKLLEHELDCFVILKNSEEEVSEEFNDQVFIDYDVVYIATNGARAISINSCEGQNVQVITDCSNTNTEVVQSWARFRKAYVHAIVLWNQTSGRVENPNFDDNAHKQNLLKISKTDDPDCELQSTSLTGEERKNSRYPDLMNVSCSVYKEWIIKAPVSNYRIACSVEQFNASNLVPYINPNLVYLEAEMMRRDIPKHLKIKTKGESVGKTVGKAKKSLGETDKAKKIIQFLKANTGMTQVSLINKWKETYPKDKVLSSATITKWNNLIKEGKV